MGRHVLRGRFWRNVTERRSGGRSLHLTLLDPLELGYMLLSLQKSRASISRRILQWSLALGVMSIPQIPASAPFINARRGPTQRWKELPFVSRHVMSWIRIKLQSRVSGIKPFGATGYVSSSKACRLTHRLFIEPRQDE